MALSPPSLSSAAVSAPLPRVAFVYANRRGELAAEAAAGTAPDTALLGQNHLRGHGIEAFVHDPRLMRRKRGGLADRLAWHLRELVVPWELTATDAIFTPLANLLPLTASARRIGVVVVNYGFNLIAARSSRARRRALARSLRTARRVFCLGESQRAELLELTQLPPEHVETALFGVDARFFREQPPPRDGVVLSVGRDLARDYETLAAAVAGLDARVVVVTLPRNVERTRLPSNVEVRVGLTHAELRELYAAAACVVLPIRADGYPYGSEASGLTALLEALASGRAVVASERAILRDYVVPDETALLVPPAEPEALREALGRALSDPALAASLGRAGRARVEAAHTTRHFAARIAPALREAAAR
jgi:glycosyltransferase involved in cell wall biosynthesis